MEAQMFMKFILVAHDYRMNLSFNFHKAISGTECMNDLKPVCKFKFLCCLAVYVKRLTNLDLGGALEGVKISLVRSMKV